MQRPIIKISMLALFIFYSFALYAQNTIQQKETQTQSQSQSLQTQEQDDQSFAKFKETCVSAWMERVGSTSDKVAFLNFGEKYCQCALGKPMDDDNAIRKAAQTCMSQTLLHDSMDTLAEQKNVSNLTVEKIGATCKDKLNLVYPDMDDKTKQAASAYCQCAGEKLVDVSTQKTNLTDQQYNDKINEVAATCASKIEADVGATGGHPKS